MDQAEKLRNIIKLQKSSKEYFHEARAPLADARTRGSGTGRLSFSEDMMSVGAVDGRD